MKVNGPSGPGPAAASRGPASQSGSGFSLGDLGGASDAAPMARAGGVSPLGSLDALIALFDHYWAASVPLLLDDGATDGADDAGGAPVGDDRRILSLLLAGATDATVARQLDISVRTVQRRVTEMMATAGVGTRIQLGRHAAERGWV